MATTTRLTVVVVDDVEEYREIVRYILARAPDMKIVGEATDGEEALNLVRLHRPDLVITDLMMPRLNGIDLTTHIRRELPRTRIILMSSFTEATYRHMASDSRADVFVSKAALHDALLPAIRHLVRPTLGDLLYTNRAKAPVSEREWAGLIRATAGGDRSALHALYTRTHRIVFSLLVRITGNRDIAEELMSEVFHDVWRSAPGYDPADGSVVGWIMHQARSSALGRLRIDPREQRIDDPADRALDTGEHLLVWARLAQRIATEEGEASVVSTPDGVPESVWEDVASGISCRLLATDEENERVSMLVRLAPGAAYPPHHHAGVEELYLLDGKLVIDDKTLYPGDYNRAEPDTGDQLVWSETGCTCVLLTSTRDVLR